MKSSTTRFVLALLLGALAVAVPCRHAGAAVLPGIVGQWTMDEASGTTAADSISGNNLSLVGWTGNAPVRVSGMFGNALRFNTPGAYGLTASPIIGPQYTVSFWSRLDQNMANDSTMFTPEGDNWVTYRRSVGLGVGMGTVFDPRQPVVGIWEHYAIAFNQATGSVAVYREGVLANSGTVSLPAFNNRWVFGHNQDLGNASSSWRGAFDEVQIYNRILTPSEVNQLAARPAQPSLTAHLVAPATNFGSQPNGTYSTRSVSVFIDPAQTKWVAWNRFPDLRAVTDTLPGQLLLGAYQPEVDDFFNLKVTNPLGATATVAMDQNGVVGDPIGPQSVIFGASDVPVVVRGNNVGSPTFLTEGGTHNALFSVAGTYTFEFAFGNIGGPAGYPDVYLLVQSVPEPSSLALCGVGAVLLLFVARRSRSARRCSLSRVPA